jgi:hypothetical protein
MSEIIGLTLSSTKLETAAGESVETSLTIRNLSLIVDRYHITVEGLDPTWWTLSIPAFSLFPRDQGEIKLTIHPPRDTEAKAGSYSFRVKATSEANPDEVTIVEALLLLHGFVVYEIEMSPTKITGRSGTYNITAHNLGNTDAVIVLEAKDPEEALLYSFDNDKVTVPAGGSSKIHLTVRPKKDEPQKFYTFEVLSRQSSKEKTLARNVQALMGQLECPRQKRKFPWRLALVVAGIIIIAAIVTWVVLARSTPENIITVTSPNGGEKWPIGSSQNITWTTTQDVDSSSSIQLEYSTNSGESWLNITTVKAGISRDIDQNSYAWRIPYTLSSSCLVRVTVRDAKNEILTQDITDNTFSITYATPISPDNPVISPEGTTDTTK